ncbi:MAG: hypothetical protein ACHQY2_01320 [Candidatus Eremiobacterales bacterium]
MDDLLKAMVEKGASDLHIVVGSPPMIRLHGRLEPIATEVISPGAAQELVAAISKVEETNALIENREVDVA